MIESLAFPQEKGDLVEIDMREYYFERVDPDHSMFYRAPQGSSYPDFMVAGEDGHPRRPIPADMNALFAANRIIFRPKPLSVASRRLARNMALDATQVRKMDPKAELRIAITNYCEEHCRSLSDNAMFPVIRKAIQDPLIAKLNRTGWEPHPTTVREWLRDRGEQGRRKLRDGVSLAGRYKRPIVTHHPAEILLYHVAQALIANEQRQIFSHYECYAAEIARINRGQPLSRNLLIEDAEGTFHVSGELAAYDKPAQPYRAISYPTFWRHVTQCKTPELFGLATSKRGQRARYGGGGFGERPAFGSLCEMDETPVPSLFLVDDETAIGMGPATLTLMVECSTRALVGWDLCAEAASAASLLRTVKHANAIKDVPSDLLEQFPDLRFVRLRPDRIKVDNSPGAHSRHFEDACAEAFIQVNFVGKDSPTHKPLVERTIGTMLDMLFKKLPEHNYDIALMRMLGFKPDEQSLCSLSTARELLDRACFTYNISTSGRA